MIPRGIHFPTLVARPTSRNCDVRMGVRVRASSRDSITATDIVTPNWKKNLPMMPDIKATGTNTASTAMEAAMAAKVISFAPIMAALIRLILDSIGLDHIPQAWDKDLHVEILFTHDRPFDGPLINFQKRHHLSALLPMAETFSS
jgi:hypothetical protein